MTKTRPKDDPTGGSYASPQTPTAELIKRVSGWVRAGCEPVLAARATGVPRGTHEQWRQRGRVELADGTVAVESAYAAYERAIDAAEARATVDAVLRLSEAAKHDPRAAKALLERAGKKIDITQHIRDRAVAEGLDPDEAVRDAIAIIREHR